MRVYNLTNGPVVYKGKQIPPNGGSTEMGDLSFIPDRDLALETARVLSFGRLPDWWNASRVAKPTDAPPSVAVVIPSGGDNKKPETLEKKIVVTSDSDSEKPKKK